MTHERYRYVCLINYYPRCVPGAFIHACTSCGCQLISDVDRSKDQTEEERATESGTCGFLKSWEIGGGRAFKSIHAASNCSTQTQIDLRCKLLPACSKFTAWVLFFSFIIRGSDIGVTLNAREVKAADDRLCSIARAPLANCPMLPSASVTVTTARVFPPPWLSLVSLLNFSNLLNRQYLMLFSSWEHCQHGDRSLAMRWYQAIQGAS